MTSPSANCVRCDRGSGISQSHGVLSSSSSGRPQGYAPSTILLASAIDSPMPNHTTRCEWFGMMMNSSRAMVGNHAGNVNQTSVQMAASVGSARTYACPWSAHCHEISARRRVIMLGMANRTPMVFVRVVRHGSFINVGAYPCGRPDGRVRAGTSPARTRLVSSPTTRSPADHSGPAARACPRTPA